MNEVVIEEQKIVDAPPLTATAALIASERGTHEVVAEPSQTSLAAEMVSARSDTRGKSAVTSITNKSKGADEAGIMEGQNLVVAMGSREGLSAKSSDRSEKKYKSKNTNKVLADIENTIRCPIQEPLITFLNLETVSAKNISRALRAKSKDVSK